MAYPSDPLLNLRSPLPDLQVFYRKILETDLVGKSVLVVGCDSGTFCFDALERGAARVTGIDCNPRLIASASAAAEEHKCSIRFLVMDTDFAFPEEKFDIVVCLNEVHFSRFPLRLLHLLAKATQEMLYLQSIDPPEERLARLFDVAGIPRRLRNILNQHSLGVILDRETRFHGPYYLPGPALQKILLTQSHFFADVDLVDTGLSGRRLVAARRRQVDQVLFIAGPDGAGKSHLANQILRGEAQVVTHHLGMDDLSGWVRANPSSLGSTDDRKARKLIVHYNILRPFKGRNAHWPRDKMFTLAATSQTIHFVTVWTDTEELRTRIITRMASHRAGKRLNGQKRVLHFYRDEGRLRNLYKEWLAFCETFSPAHNLVIDTLGEPKVYTPEAWISEG